MNNAQKFDNFLKETKKVLENVKLVMYFLKKLRMVIWNMFVLEV